MDDSVFFSQVLFPDISVELRTLCLLGLSGHG